MMICPYDTCTNNHDGACIKPDVVLEIVNQEDETLTCKCYQREERKDKEDD